LNILYISKLSGLKSAGLTYSVPAQVNSQKKFDNVFLYNLNHTPKEVFNQSGNYYNLIDYPDISIKKLPTPFNKPDLIIFQGIYFFEYIKLYKECLKEKIPYVIIPRGSLTNQAQKKKKVKKLIANQLFFNTFIINAVAIQYLTKQEMLDSGDKWNTKSIIIPNGIEKKSKTKKYSQNLDSITGTFIGRSDIYHKGIDLLIEACVKMKSKLELNNCTINLYAPMTSNDNDPIQILIEKNGLGSIMKRMNGVYGSEKEQVLLESDFFILTSRFEGHPMGLIEALSFGLPCLVTTGTNMAEEINSMNAGWIAEVNSESIKIALDKLVEEKENLKIKGLHALKLSQRYDWDSLASESNEIYTNLICNLQLEGDK